MPYTRGGKDGVCIMWNAGMKPGRFGVRLGMDRIGFVVLAFLFSACASSAPIPKTSAAPQDRTEPPGMLLSEAVSPETARDWIARLQERMARAQKWERPVWMPTLFSRLRLPLPAVCGGWGRVAVVAPSAREESPRPADAFVFLVERLPPVRGFGEPSGPEGEPQKAGSGEGPPVSACLVTAWPADGQKAAVAVIPLWSDGRLRFVEAHSVKDGFLLHARAESHPLRSDWPGLAWKNGDLLLWLRPGRAHPVRLETPPPGLAPQAGVQLNLMEFPGAMNGVVLIVRPSPSDDVPAGDDAESAHSQEGEGESGSGEADVSGDAFCFWLLEDGRLEPLPMDAIRLLAEKNPGISCRHSRANEANDR